MEMIKNESPKLVRIATYVGHISSHIIPVSLTCQVSLAVIVSGLNLYLSSLRSAFLHNGPESCSPDTQTHAQSRLSFHQERNTDRRQRFWNAEQSFGAVVLQRPCISQQSKGA